MEDVEVFFFFRQRTAYEITGCREFRGVLFRSLPPPHDPPQIVENRHGVGRNEFRVLDDSRSHKSPENVAVQRIEKTIAVYNPEVVGSSHAPQSQNRLIS